MFGYVGYYVVCYVDGDAIAVVVGCVVVVCCFVGVYGVLLRSISVLFMLTIVLCCWCIYCGCYAGYVVVVVVITVLGCGVDCDADYVVGIAVVDVNNNITKHQQHNRQQQLHQQY